METACGAKNGRILPPQWHTDIQSVSIGMIDDSVIHTRMNQETFMASENNWLITEYVIWNINTGNITVVKNEKDTIELKIGV